MNKRFIVYVLLMLLGCTRAKETPLYVPKASDTLYTAQAAMMVYGTHPDRALAIIDSALIVGNVEPFQADFLRAKVYAHSVNGDQLDKALSLCTDLLQRDSAQVGSPSAEKNRRNVLQLMMDVSRQKNDDENWIRYAMERAELCRVCGMETEALRMEAEIGAVFTRIGRLEEGLVKLEQVIRVLDEGAPSIDRMDAGIVARKRRIGVYDRVGRYGDIIPDAQAILGKLDDYVSRPSAYAEDSFRLPPIEADRVRYCQYYRAQAQVCLANAYAKVTPVNLAEARKWLKQVEASDYGNTFSVKKQLAPVWKALGLWDKLLAFDAEAVQRMGADTLNADYATILKDWADVATERRQYASALSYMGRYARLNEMLSQKRHETEAQEYAARFHAMDQERRLQEEMEKSARKDGIIAFVIVLLLLITVFAFFSVRQRHAITLKNRALVRMIGELSHSQEALQPETPQLDRDLFEQIDGSIRKEKLYANVLLQRQDIVERFGINRHALNGLLSAYADGQSFTAYINNIRLEDAIHLLQGKPELSISQIAEAVGFTPANLREQFKRRYGMTPTEYRQNLEIEQ